MLAKPIIISRVPSQCYKYICTGIYSKSDRVLCFYYLCMSIANDMYMYHICTYGPTFASSTMSRHYGYRYTHTVCTITYSLYMYLFFGRYTVADTDRWHDYWCNTTVWACKNWHIHNCVQGARVQLPGSSRSLCSLIPRPPHPALIACSTKSRGKAWTDLSCDACHG